MRSSSGVPSLNSPCRLLSTIDTFRVTDGSDGSVGEPFLNLVPSAVGKPSTNQRFREDPDPEKTAQQSDEPHHRPDDSALSISLQRPSRNAQSCWPPMSWMRWYGASAM